MARTDSQKNSRSSRFENPANCETLFRRTSMSRTRPGRRSLPKNSRADFLVKPMVKIFKSRPPGLVRLIDVRLNNESHQTWTAQLAKKLPRGFLSETDGKNLQVAASRS